MRHGVGSGLSILLILVATTGAVEAADTVLVPRGATWAYRDNGSNQGTAWRGVGFDHSSWAQGPAELGYGDGGEATTVSFGPNASQQVHHHLLPALVPGQRSRRVLESPLAPRARRRSRRLPQRHRGAPRQHARRHREFHYPGLGRDRRRGRDRRSSRPRCRRPPWSRAPTSSRSRCIRRVAHQHATSASTSSWSRATAVPASRADPICSSAHPTPSSCAGARRRPTDSRVVYGPALADSRRRGLRPDAHHRPRGPARWTRSRPPATTTR